MVTELRNDIVRHPLVIPERVEDARKRAYGGVRNDMDDQPATWRTLLSIFGATRVDQLDPIVFAPDIAQPVTHVTAQNE